jgi:hypothetical protein
MPDANSVLAACGGFLLAVLWMDLMFDVQVLRQGEPGSELPEEVLASIAAYYRRVTTTAWPMGHLVGTVMGVLVATLLVQLAWGPRWLALVSLAPAGIPIALAGARVVPNAMRLGARVDTIERQSELARSIFRDHVLCFAGISAFVVLQLVAVGG